MQQYLPVFNCRAGRLFVSGQKIVFLHSLSAAVVLPLSHLDSLLFYDGVSYLHS